MGNKAVKTPIGMVLSYFFPFASEPAGAHPVYGSKIDMGAAVKGYLRVNTATADVYGDDALLVPIELFVSGQMDVETTLSDLEVNAALFGHRFEAGRETSNGDDAAPNGAYAFIQAIMKKDKSIIYRPTFLRKVAAMPQSEKQESDTKKEGLDPKMNAVSLKVMKDNLGDWREREDFGSLAEAEAFIDELAGESAAYAVRIQHSGVGASTPGVGTTYVTAGQSQVIDFGTNDPDKLYDNGADVTASIASHKYTISAIAADHDLVAIWTT